jgi:hypothetical protein
LRYFILLGLWFSLILLFVACDDNGNGPNDDPITITNGRTFFPVADGNRWSYNNGAVIRQLDGDTVINGDTCARLFSGGVTEEAWTLTDERFAQHLLAQVIWFDPPLQIPFDLEKDKPYEFSSIGREVGDTTARGRYYGTLTFKGYVSQTVMGNDYDSLLHLDYHVTVFNFSDSSESVSDFEEYYARGIGLVLSPDPNPNFALNLDSARINGFWQP